MSPLSAPFPCPYLIQKEDLYFCRIYARSPKLCREFNFEDFLYCPYGLNELQLYYPEDAEKLRERVEKGARLLADLRHD